MTKETPNVVLASDATKKNPVFDPESFWYVPIEKSVSLHPNSTNLVAAFIRQKAAGLKDIVGINTRSYSSPIYIANGDTSTITVHVDRCPDLGNADFEGLATQFKAVPVPEFAEPACGDDAEMTIYQPSSDTMWEFWRAKRTTTGEWQACWGGRMDNVSKSSGIWPNLFGATATGLPFAGGQITPEELDAGEINHVIGIALVQADKTFSWPATHSDGVGCGGALCIPEGARFRLDPDVKVDELKIHRVGKIIARAAQKYGFVVWDKAATTSLRAKNPKSYTQIGGKDPYSKLFDPNDQWTVLDGFPWDRLQFLPFDNRSLDSAEPRR